MHLIIDVSVQSVRISKMEFVEKNSHSLDFSIIKVMCHIPNLVIIRSLDKRKYADKRVSIKSEVVDNFELKIETKNELATNTPGTCTLHTHLHAGGAIIRKGNNFQEHLFEILRLRKYQTSLQNFFPT